MNVLKDLLPQKGLFMVIGGAVSVALFLIFFLPAGEKGESEKEQHAVFPWEEETGEEEVSESQEAFKQETFIVDIKGEVVNTGIYTVEEGERVQDAILKAGGFTGNANDKLINLAERCYDEMVIYVPSMDEEYENILPASPAQAGTSSQQEGILINSASAEELTALPGIGPAKADAIINYRDENGPFKSGEELKEVPGIGEKTLENIVDKIIIR
ncbi:helix-hairpin-helix domain-containing protein [Salipaludibacillus sp. CUR1]|uniref:helix-hairpin-helix domain-containing protein n=1 Tax=Salipaludibacillus sp. CUR1 TaxID=2820003 RepID=UPI001E5D2A83|nr:helix-hairpin-helix domain-containing protein [Salipaludibacillus sp. CUR1]MCE7794183.1 helix-hairpin-helix domain-containing protein [Salipaludibacillus sp. CUR1]